MGGRSSLRHWAGWEDPGAFIEDACGVQLWSGMRLAMESVIEHKRTSIRACHGVSKTMTAACVAVEFFATLPKSVVVTTAPTHRQVARLLWKEIGALYDANRQRIRDGLTRWQLPGSYTTLSIRPKPDWYMFGFSTDRASKIEGFHAPYILWILDEAKGLPQWVYDAVESSMTGGMSRVLEISTTDGAGAQSPLRKHHTNERDEWNAVHISAFDSPFVNPQRLTTSDRELVNPELYRLGKRKTRAEWPARLGRSIQVTSPEWIEERRRWQVRRPELWTTKVLGHFSKGADNAIIPLEWIESAINAEVPDAESPHDWGLDVAAEGGDQSVLYERRGRRVMPAHTWDRQPTTATAGEVIALVRGDRSATVKVDMIGVGRGVFDMIWEQEPCGVAGVDSSAKAILEPAVYQNLRAEMWFRAAAVFEAQHERGNVLSIPDDDELVEDLSGMRYITRSSGKRQVEDKKLFRSRFGRSPNRGDALIYLLAEIPEEAPYETYWDPQEAQRHYINEEVGA